MTFDFTMVTTFFNVNRVMDKSSWMMLSITLAATLNSNRISVEWFPIQSSRKTWWFVMTTIMTSVTPFFFACWYFIIYCVPTTVATPTAPVIILWPTLYSLFSFSSLLPLFVLSFIFFCICFVMRPAASPAAAGATLRFPADRDTSKIPTARISSLRKAEISFCYCWDLTILIVVFVCLFVWIVCVCFLVCLCFRLCLFALMIAPN